MRLKAVIFDVDGTLVDSQADIMSSMSAAFDLVGRELPNRQEILSRVGLSLPEFFADLLPHVPQTETAQMANLYKEAYAAARLAKGSVQSSPLFDGARAALDQLKKRDEVLLGVATGKSRRGLMSLIEGHQLDGYFLTQQVADDHPSKPNPAMLDAACAELGVDPSEAVMIGDTEFDMRMGRAAGTRCIGVSWGYHTVTRLSEADVVIDQFDALIPALEMIWSETDV